MHFERARGIAVQIKVQPMQSTDYLNTPQAAAYLHISASALNKWRVYGDGPPFVKMGRTVRYRRQDLNIWAAKVLRKSTSNGNFKKSPPFGGPACDTSNQPRRSARPPKQRNGMEPAR
jgi:predicted DNA-binding transcriptional regulator AlpA